MEEENKGSSSSAYNFYEDEDEESTPAATPAAKPDARVVQSIYALVVDVVAKELRTDEHEDQSLSHQRQYGLCHKPFGTMRMRAVEFLYEAFRVFYSHDFHHILLACDLYNRLLYYFCKYPFHNILHQKVTDIFIYLMDKGSDSEDIMNSVLYETDLVKKILDIYRESNLFKLENTQHTVTSGYMAFIRKLANKLVTVSKKQEEVVNFLDSIPEWSEFLCSHLEKRNELEAKQLGNKKQSLAAVEDDDDSDENSGGGNSLSNLLFKISSIGGGKQDDDDSDSSDEEQQ